MRATAGALPPSRWWLISALLIGLGLLQSLYLLERGFELLSSRGPRWPDLCSALFAGGCDGAITDQRFSLLGVPVAGWGLVYFASLAGLLLVGRFVKRAFEPEALLAALVLTAAGLAAGLALTLTAWLDEGRVCPLCLSVHAASLALLAALWRASGRSPAEHAWQLRDGWRALARSELPEAVRWKLVGFGCVALVAAMTFQWVFVEASLRLPNGGRKPNRDQVLTAYRAAPRVDLPVSEVDPHLGSLTAPVRLVVFESFRCPACRRFAPTLRRLRSRFGDRLLIVYKHYPLSPACNGRVMRDLQPGSCETAWAAEAARRQGRFWRFYDAYLASRADAPLAAIGDAMRHTDVDPDRFQADRASGATKERVGEDIALGNRLKIPGTPSVFLDGRFVSTPSVEVLDLLIRDALAPRVAATLPPARAGGRAGGGGPLLEGRLIATAVAHRAARCEPFK
jgi:protein-disulfide isomerase